MKVLLQRVENASVEAGGVRVGAIGRGLLVFAGVEKGDKASEALRMASKIARFRIFEDEQGKMNRSVLETRGEILLISQFTLAADVEHGNRPGFDPAERPESAKTILEILARGMREEGLEVREGVFGSRMKVRLTNEGPVTFLLASSPVGPRRDAALGF
ncbi:MAG: D-aminoacyl-tRNA deacylase [Candidatus Omnitrophota bacterium]